MVSESHEGIVFYNSTESLILNNSVHSNNDGILLYKSSDNDLQGNNIYSNNNYGIIIYEASSRNILKENKVDLNYFAGIGIDTFSGAVSEQNIITDNIVQFRDYYGMNIRASNSTIKRNKIIEVGGPAIIGVRLLSSNNAVYDNLFYNSRAEDFGVNNSWNTTLTSGLNILGGPYIGGNFWYAYNGQDTNGDGIGDTNLPHTSNGDIPGDWLPLTNPVNCGDTIHNDVIIVDTLTCQDNGLIFGDNGITLDCNGNIIQGQYLPSTSGIKLQNKNNNIVKNCDVRGFGKGIHIESSSNNTIINSKTYSNHYYEGIMGLVLENSNSNTFKNNLIAASGFTNASLLKFSSENKFLNNTVKTYSGLGIIFQSSPNNIIVDSNITSSFGSGLLFGSNSNNNLIYNNLFQSNVQDYGVNLWNITKTKGTNIIGGPVISGNYWSDYNGTDLNGDGIGDTNLPYNIGISNGGDYGPLTNTSGRVRARFSPELGIKSSGLQKAFPILFVIILAIIITLIILLVKSKSKITKNKKRK